MNKKIDLKPCPFCGGEAIISEGITLKIKGIAYMVHCQKCDTMSGMYGSKRSAKKHWNKRINNRK